MVQEINNIQKQFFVGCMLGDGNMKKPKGAINAMFTCQHGPSQAEYNKWKYNLLETLGAKYYEYTRKTPNKKTGKYYTYNITVTNCNKEITKMYDILYSTGTKRITKEILKDFTEFSLAILFMDDGNLTRKDVNSSYTIASCGFDIESLKLFQQFLLDKWNIDTTITYDNRIYIKMNSRNLFEYIVSPYVQNIECMRYKLRKITSRNSVNCLESPEKDNQQPSLSGNTLEGSTTSSESLRDNNSTTSAEQFTDARTEYLNYIRNNKNSEFIAYR